jgi:putative membrane protein insertion efficiency factor
MGKGKVSIFSYPFIWGIWIYRYTLSPLIGQQCRFYPTCSRYAEEALREHGAFGGLILSIKRILRCHPWNDGGYDPIPPRKIH